MKCWLSLGRWFDSGSKEFGFKFGTQVSTFSSYFVLPDKKKGHKSRSKPNPLHNRRNVVHITFTTKSSLISLNDQIKKKAIGQDPNLSRYVTEGTFSILDITR